MKIVFFSSDLMFQSRVSSVVRQGGNELIVVRDVDSLRERNIPAEALKIAVLDLSLNSIDLNDVIGALKKDYPEVLVVAYGAHVDVEALENAQGAGADIVLTRGQFDRDMAHILSVEPNPRP
jgi:2-keto-3-deoxy-6-phosphogluconate aldolase